MLDVFLSTDYKYLQSSTARFQRKELSGPDLQLSRLRVASDSMMTEYNPNYEFGGGTYTVRDLRDVPRENLRLVKFVTFLTFLAL